MEGRENKKLIENIAEGSGIKNLENDVINLITFEVEYRVREILINAQKLMLHSNRKVLLSQDIHNSIKMLNLKKLIGYGKPTGEDRYSSIREDHTQLWVKKTKDISLRDYLSNKVKVGTPSTKEYNFHWVALNGSQPNIPENVPRCEESPSEELGKECRVDIEGSLGDEGSEKSEKGKWELQLGKEEEMMLEEWGQCLAQHIHITNGLQYIGVQSLLPRYTTVLETMQKGCYVQKMLPYILEKLVSIEREEGTVSILLTLECLLQNSLISVEEHLHSFTSIIFNSLFGLEDKTTKLENKDQHNNPPQNAPVSIPSQSLDNKIFIIKFSTSLLKILLDKFGGKYPMLKNTIILLLGRPFLPEEVSSKNIFLDIYASIIALSKLSVTFPLDVILPNLPQLMAKINGALTSPGTPTSTHEQIARAHREVELCLSGLMEALGKGLDNISKYDCKRAVDLYNQIMDVCGEQFQPYVHFMTNAKMFIPNPLETAFI